MKLVSIVGFIFCLNLCSQLRSESIINKFLLPVEMGVEEQVKIRELWKYLSDLKPNITRMNSSFYKKRSKFEKYFGFRFEGNKLEQWLKSRIDGFKMDSSQPYIAHYSNRIVYLNRNFFRFSKLEQAVILIHEARHADGNEYQHIRCPYGFPYLSVRDPEAELEGLAACDDKQDGAYGFGAAFLFEIYSLGVLPKNKTSEILGLYNSEIARIILERK
ncbi:hypothetical protein [Leptospira yasudae]|uniref:Metallopeptidase n=1 Tax=Leptospira yasudae TaxID=2202201 RepID=A0ABX9LY23_9LEPT|nr:hypothetical protein [Leptospira yasudae]RHX77763.1 hypothetical protein DLM77_20065 [Leptospira yasudae]